jgi:hypothetical protein
VHDFHDHVADSSHDIEGSQKILTVKIPTATEIKPNMEIMKKEVVMEGDNSFTALLVGLAIFILLVIYDFKKAK